MQRHTKHHIHFLAFILAAEVQKAVNNLSYALKQTITAREQHFTAM